MAENIKLSFDDGYKNIEFNGDPDKVIRINPTDGMFLKRLAGIKDKAKQIAEKYGDVDLSALDRLKDIEENKEQVSDDAFEELKKAAEAAAQVESATRELIDSVFESPVCDVVFGDSSCLSPVGGRPVYFAFLEVIIEYIAQETRKNTAKRQVKVKKYTDKARQINIRPESISEPKATPKPFIPLAQPTSDIDVDSMTADQKKELLKRLLS
ncbi:hypothetical protein [Ruminococcus flavefaciens]|uniref:hypothetical protein n=1 Tax=Ruminococcus flavefaciens TaxID=1265 RepID=UPI0026F0B9B7|nr:hypothetical protein [Ruminococcus flavefaciens]